MRTRPATVASRCSERGETLIEMLVTIVIMGICTTALMLGLFASNNSSALDTRQVTLQGLLRSSQAEAMQKISTTAGYWDCSLTTLPLTAPSGYTVQATIQSAQSVPADTAPAATLPPRITFGSACTTQTLKKVTITVADTASKYSAKSISGVTYVRPS